MRTPRLLMGCVLAGLSMFLMSAKCIENDTVRKDPISNGDWAIYGEIHNETDIQGIEMRLQGTLFDADGNPFAAAIAQTCPEELSPGSLSVFRIPFPGTSSRPEPAGHKVTVVAGTALDQPLPKLDLTSDATVSLPPGAEFYKVAITFEANPPDVGQLGVCVAMYNQSGQVLYLESFANFTPEVVGGATRSIDVRPAFMPADATHLRYWLWSASPDDFLVANRQAFVSGLIPIQRPPPPASRR